MLGTHLPIKQSPAFKLHTLGSRPYCTWVKRSPGLGNCDPSVQPSLHQLTPEPGTVAHRQTGVAPVGSPKMAPWRVFRVNSSQPQAVWLLPPKGCTAPGTQHLQACTEVR